MDQKLSRLDQLFLHGLFNQFTGKDGEFSVGHHPAHHIAAEDVQNDIEIIIGPLLRSFQFGDIPGPDFIGGPVQEAPALYSEDGSPDFFFLSVPPLFQNTVHGTDGTEVFLFIKKCCINLLRGFIDKAVLMEKVEDFTPFRRRKGKRRFGTGRLLFYGASPSIETGTGYGKGRTGGTDADVVGKRCSGLHEFSSLAPFQEIGHFFLDFDDQLGLFELMGKLFIVPFQFCNTTGTGIGFMSTRSSLFGNETFLHLPSP